MWVFHPETFELVKVINGDHGHRGQIFHTAQVGNLVWSVAWDQKIIAWDKDFNRVRTIPHLHKDALSYIYVYNTKDPLGYTVWTGSLDRTINVTHVPENYDNVLREYDDSIDENDLPPIDQESVKPDEELPTIAFDDNFEETFIVTKKKKIKQNKREKRKNDETR